MNITFGSISQRSIALALIGFGLLVGISLVYQTCRGPDHLSPSVLDSLAAIEASKKPDSAAHAAAIARADSAKASSERLGVISEQLDRSSKKIERQAQALRAAADSSAALAAVAQNASDSAARFQTAWRLERAHADTLQIALDTARASLDTMRASRDSARAEAKAARVADSLKSARLDRVENINRDLKRDAERLSAGCKLLPFVRCPTRKEIAIAGIITAVVVKHQSDQREKERAQP
jgi:hypothetical protein